MSLQGVVPLGLEFLPHKPIVVEVADSRLTGDAGGVGDSAV